MLERVQRLSRRPAGCIILFKKTWM